MLKDCVLIAVAVAVAVDVVVAAAVVVAASTAISLKQSSSDLENLLLETVDNSLSQSLSLFPMLVLSILLVLLPAPFKTTPSICSLAILAYIR